MDIGASTHMCSDFSLLVNPAIVTSPMHVSLPDGSQVSVQYSGTVVLSPILELHNVLYIPKFQFNLLSVPKLAATSNIIFKFYPNNCLLQDLKTEHLVAVVKLVNHLYILDQSSFQIDSTVTILPACNNAKNDGISLLWHQRLGHASYRTIHHLPVCTHLPVQSHPCHVCPLAKKSRLPFPTSTIRTSKCFDILHIDIWGPYKIPSLTGAQFFLTILDDFSQATWTFLLHHKTDIFHIFSTFLTMVPTQFKTCVKTIRNDNGGEFLSTHFKTLLHSYGIIHHRSFPYTPQQNGIVEGKHRHLLDTARSLMFQASLPSPFWGHAILMATSIINRLPPSLLSWKTPFERLYQKTPTYDPLKVFGCLCFATITQPHRDNSALVPPAAFSLVFPLTKRHLSFMISPRIIYLSLGMSSSMKIFFLFKTHHHNQFLHLSLNHFFFDNPTSTTLPSSHHTSIIPTPSPTPILPTPSATPTLANPPSCPTQSMAPRRSTRLRTTPAWLSNFEVHFASTPATAPSTSAQSQATVSSTFHPIFNLSYVSFSENISSIFEPTSYKQASQDTRWLQAMEIELNALEQNHTWDLTYLPPGKSPIGSKWVYKTKLHPDGTVDRFKARLVAKGYHQIEGIDYNDRFSLVAKLVTVRLFFTIATTKAWPIHQLDINNAFLHGHLLEEVYMLPSDGYTKAALGQVCRLRRSLYGLKQASRQWNLEFCSKLTQFGFTQSAHDHRLFIKRSSKSFLALLVYVDDVLIIGTSEDDILQVKRFLHSVFSIKDLGYAKYFLGLEIARSPKGMFLHQRKYVLDILSDVGLLHAKTASTPLQRGHKFLPILLSWVSLTVIDALLDAFYMLQ